jgi:carboxymethylenebutenolidase
MKAGGIDFTSHVYAGVGHAFFNDTNPRTYDAAAAADAWRRTIGFLDRAIKSPLTAAPTRESTVSPPPTPPTVL